MPSNSTGKSALSGFCVFVFVICLLGTLVSISTNSVVTPGNLKQWLKNSQAYERVVDSVLQQSQKTLSKDQGADTLPINNPAVQAAVRKAFTPELLQNYAENVIDGTQSWLEGKTSKPQFKLDFSVPKSNFANAIGDYVKQQVTALPACKTVELPQDFNPFTATCVPKGLTADMVAQQISQQLTGSQDFLANPVVNADSIKAGNGSQPFYANLSYLPPLYRIAHIGSWIFGGLALLAAVGAVFASHPRRRGLKKLAVSMVVVGVLGDFGATLDLLIAQNLADKLKTISSSSNLMEYVYISLFQQVLKTFGHINLLLAGVTLGVGVAVLVAMAFIHHKGIAEEDNKPNVPQADEVKSPEPSETAK